MKMFTWVDWLNFSLVLSICAFYAFIDNWAAFFNAVMWLFWQTAFFGMAAKVSEEIILIRDRLSALLETSTDEET